MFVGCVYTLHIKKKQNIAAVIQRQANMLVNLTTTIDIGTVE